MAKIITLLLAVLVFNFSFAQKLDHERTSPLFFGLNIGGTWHHTDVKHKLNVGGGFVFGGTFNRDYANIFSYDLKFRYLGGSWIGQDIDTTGLQNYDGTVLNEIPTDYQNTYGYTIKNFKTKSHEFNLELSIHLNRLTERTGLDPYIFGGVGATFFRARANLTDDMGFLYDYSLLNDYNKTSLQNFMDNTYETPLDGNKNGINARFMGHLGFGLGYYFTRNFAMGFEHKTGFTGGDIYDGAISSVGKYKKDLYHYTSLYLKIYFNRGRHSGPTPHPQPNPNPNPNPTNPNPTNPTTPVDCPNPIINLQTASNITVDQPVFQVNATITNSNSQNILVTHNGTHTADYTYNNNSFNGRFNLQPGANTLVITASNSCGQVSQTIQVNYVPACITPTVNVTNPGITNSATTNSSIAIQAQISNLGSGAVQMAVNGQQSTNFNYNPNSGILSGTVNLRSGNNTIQLTVSNECGSNSQTIYVDYSAICPTPVINIKTPTTTYGTSNRVEVAFGVQNVSNATQIEVFLNGNKQTAGTYTLANYKKLMTLSTGTNTILIRASNNCGTSEQTLVYEVGQPCIEPTVSFTTPAVSRVTSSTKSYTVQAKIQQVTNPQNIVFKVNNVVVSNFNYSVQTGLFSANIQLENGSNVIELSVINPCGSASASAAIAYSEPCDSPVITLKQPLSNTTVFSENFNFEAYINNISAASNVVLSLNGIVQSTGTYSSSSKIYSKALNLQRDNNVIQITATNSCGSVTSSVSIYVKIETVNCPNPVIKLQTASNTTVNLPVFQVTGTINNTTLQGISATHNGIQTGDVVYSNNETFRGTFNLQPGLNTIVLNASNQCGIASQTIYVNYVPACDIPSVNFTNPTTANSSTTNGSIAIQARITNLGDGLAQLYINGQQSTNFNYNNASGILSSTINLQNGNNTIQIVVSNACGTNSQTIYVVYNKVCPAPIVKIQGPTTNHGTISRVELVANIQNISNANQVDVYVNGQKQATGAYINGIYKKQLTLSNGTNTIVVRATNSCGTSEQSLVYELGQPCIDPTVHITNPSGPRASSTSKSFTVQATIQNVTNPQNILFKVNNTIVSSFNYSIQTGLFTANIQLENGSNTVEISVNNECGHASASSTISYTAPCDKPVVTLKQPSANTTVSSVNFNFEATIANISSANDVVLSLNGENQSTGTYATGSKIYSKQLKLQKGNNVIVVTASNHCGSTSATVNIHVKTETVITGDKPVVVFTNNCDVKIAAGLIKFTGNVFGVSETSQIQVKLQNVVQNNVVYKRIGNGFSFELDVRAGYSQTFPMQITANNMFGTAVGNCQIATEDAPIVDKDIQICHTVNGVKQTIVIKESEWGQYQKLGATKGQCPEVVDRDIVICYNMRGKQVTLTIKESQWAQYEKLGAKKGVCPEAVDNDIVICMPKGKERVTMTIKESQWQSYRVQGATLGECPQIVDNDIIVCVPQGRDKVTMTIKESQWPQYQAQGATLGACPIYDPEIQICLRIGSTLKTMTIKQSQWPQYQAQGATIGACPEIVDADIVICALNGKERQTITIKQSQWPQYQAQGATLGACQTSSTTSDTTSTSNEVTAGNMLICIEENGVFVTKTILATEWKKYERLGATKGACAEKSGVIRPNKGNVQGEEIKFPGQTQTPQAPQTQPRTPGTINRRQ